MAVGQRQEGEFRSRLFRGILVRPRLACNSDKIRRRVSLYRESFSLISLSQLELRVVNGSPRARMINEIQ
jgi:hypothetical protein